MKISEILSEGLSPALFHYTDGASATNILKTGVFKLSATDDETFRKPEENEPPYYLSATRTVTGEYHMNGNNIRRWNENIHVMFDLDGRFYARHHRGGQITTKHVEYDDEFNPIASTYDQAASRSEAEDRIWSNQPTLSIGGVTSIHILKAHQTTDDAITNIVALARHRKIPIFVYDQLKYWLAQSHKHALKI
jgi:hypothetical protein